MSSTTTTMVKQREMREIVITSDPSQVNGVPSSAEKKENGNIETLEHDETDLSTSSSSTSFTERAKGLWTAIPDEVKLFAWDSLRALAALVGLFLAVVVFRVGKERFEDNTGFFCNAASSIDSWLGTSLSSSVCEAHADIVSRLGHHTAALHGELANGLATFGEQLSDGFSAAATIAGTVTHYYTALIADALSELVGNVGENVSFLKDFAASGVEFFQRGIDSFLERLQETVAPAN